MKVWVFSTFKTLPDGKQVLSTADAFYDTQYGRTKLREVMAAAFASDYFAFYSFTVRAVEVPQDVFETCLSLRTDLRGWLSANSHQLSVPAMSASPGPEPACEDSVRDVLMAYTSLRITPTAALARIASLYPAGLGEPLPSPEDMVHSIFELYSNKHIDAVTALYRVKQALGLNFPNLPVGTDDYDNPT